MVTAPSQLPRPLPANPELLARLGPLTPVRTLAYYDFDLLYTAYDTSGQLRLLFWYEFSLEGQFDTFLVVPLTAEVLTDLVEGRISLLAALDQPVAWVVDMYYEHGPVRALELSGIKGLPAASLPLPNVTLGR